MDKRVEKTRLAIRKAYFNLRQVKERSKITVTDIAREANIDRKTFYLHYSSVDDVPSEFVEYKTGQLQKSLEEARCFENPVSIKAALKALSDLVESDKVFLKQMAGSHLSDYFWDKAEEMLVNVVIEIYSGFVRISEDVLRLHIEFTIAGVIRSYRNWLVSGEQSLEEIENALTDIIMHGFASELNV